MLKYTIINILLNVHVFVFRTLPVWYVLVVDNNLHSIPLFTTQSCKLTVAEHIIVLAVT